MSDPTNTPTTNPSTDAMLAKIRKLLAKAEDEATTPAEAELFTAKAAELIAKYGIDAALLAEADPTTDRIGDRVIVLDAPYARDKGDLLATVAFALRCKVVQRSRWVNGSKQLSLHLFGYGADLDRVELLYTSLLVQAAHALAATYVPYGDNVAAFRRTWYAGYASAIGRRLRAAEQRAQAEANHTRPAETGPAADSGRSVALVLADRKTHVEAALQTAYPKLRAGRARQLSGSGYSGGYAAGQRADLGGSRLAGHTRPSQQIGA